MAPAHHFFVVSGKRREGDVFWSFVRYAKDIFFLCNTQRPYSLHDDKVVRSNAKADVATHRRIIINLRSSDRPADEVILTRRKLLERGVWDVCLRSGLHPRRVFLPG